MSNNDGVITKRLLKNALSRVKLLAELSIPLPSSIKMRHDPIILLGMHRSGTTMLSKILSNFNVHMGYRNGKLNEASFFLDTNLVIMELFRAFWDYPNNMLILKDLKQNSILEVSGQLEKWVNSYRFLKSYVGLKNGKKFYKTKSVLWGWKEPRTTVTWPLWMNVFDAPKFIFIYRNGIDVAESLRKAEINSANLLGTKHSSVRATSIESAFQIWEEYNKIFYVFKNWLINADIMEICYEDMLLYPHKNFKKIMRFLNIEISESRLKIISERIDPSRRYSFINDNDLYKFYKRKKDNLWMHRFGYDYIKK